MEKSIKTEASIYALWRHLSKRRRQQHYLLLILMVIVAFAEVVTLGAVLPFLAALTEPDKLFFNSYAQPVVTYFEYQTPEQIILPFTILFACSAVFAGVIRLVMLYVSTRLSYATGNDLSIEIFERTLYQPYSVHLLRNSSEVINGIVRKTDIVTRSVLLPMLTLVSSIVILTFIVAALVSLEPIISLSLFLSFGLVYWITIRLVRKKLLINGESIAAESTRIVKIIQEGLGGIRDILIDNSHPHFFSIYRKADKILRHTQGSNQFLSIFPRYAMESLGMVLIAFLAYNLSQRTEGIGSAVPLLGAIVFGAQRLLPILQQCYTAISHIKGSQASLRDTLDLLSQPLPAYLQEDFNEVIAYEENICLNRVGFRYNESQNWILKNIDITIDKGERIGFVGTTGSGKSTLVDIIMGLLEPSEGTIAVDGNPLNDKNKRGWQANIAHVPQHVFLADCSVEENIAFGVPADKIDKALVRQAAFKAQISDIESWPDQYQTIIGERGARLSGGQRQRIGIARALYKNANVIVFDEATSALDFDTEHAVMAAIDSLDKELTILIIAHRLSTLKGCDRIVEIGGGGVVRIGKYYDLVNIPYAV